MRGRTLRLKHVAALRVSNVDKKSHSNEIPVRLVNYTDVYYRDRIVPELELMRATATVDEVEAFHLLPGDVIITKDSETASDIGIAAYVERSSSDLVCGYHLAICRPRSMYVNSRFLFWALNSDDTRGQLSSGATGVTRYGLRADVIGDVRIVVPPLCEQRTIVDYLDMETARIDALISKKRRMLELADSRWVAEVVQMTTGDGQGWNERRLRRVLQSIIGGAWGSEPGEGEVEALCIRGADFDTANIGVEKSKAPIRGFGRKEFLARELRAGDLLIEKSGGGDLQPVGRVVRWSGDEPAVPTNFVARVRPRENMDSQYLAFVFRAAYETGCTRAWIKQTTGIQNLDLLGFLSGKCPVPPLALIVHGVGVCGGARPRKSLSDVG